MVYNITKQSDLTSIRTVGYEILPSKVSVDGIHSSILPDQPSTQIHALNLDSKSSEELLPMLRPSRKGTRLNEAAEFNAPPPQARDKILCESLLKSNSCSLGLPLRKFEADQDVLEFCSSNTTDLHFALLNPSQTENPSDTGETCNRSPGAPLARKVNVMSSHKRAVYEAPSVTKDVEGAKLKNLSPSCPTRENSKDSVPRVVDLFSEQHCSINYMEIANKPFRRPLRSRNNEIHFTEFTPDDKILQRSLRESGDRYNSLIRPDVLYSVADVFDETETSPLALALESTDDKQEQSNLQPTDRVDERHVRALEETATDFASNRAIRITYRGKQLFISRLSADGQPETIIYPIDEFQNNCLESDRSSIIEITFKTADDKSIDQNIKVPVRNNSQEKYSVVVNQAEELGWKENNRLPPADQKLLNESLSVGRENFMRKAVFSEATMKNEVERETVASSKEVIPQGKETSRNAAVEEAKPVDLVGTSTAQEDVDRQSRHTSRRQSAFSNSEQSGSSPVRNRKSVLRFSEMPVQNFVYSTILSTASEQPPNRAPSGLCPCMAIMKGARQSGTSRKSTQQQSVVCSGSVNQESCQMSPESNVRTSTRQSSRKSTQQQSVVCSGSVNQESCQMPPESNVRTSTRQSFPICTCDENTQERFLSTASKRPNIYIPIVNEDQSEKRSTNHYSINHQIERQSRSGDGKQSVPTPKSRPSNLQNTLQDDYSKRKSSNISFFRNKGSHVTNASLSQNQKSYQENRSGSKPISTDIKVRLSDLAALETDGSQLFPPKNMDPTTRYSRTIIAAPLVHTVWNAKRLSIIKPPQTVNSRQNVSCPCAEIVNTGASGEGWVQAPIATYSTAENPENAQHVSRNLPSRASYVKTTSQVSRSLRNPSVIYVYSATTLPENSSSGDASYQDAQGRSRSRVQDSSAPFVSETVGRERSSVCPSIYSTAQTDKRNESQCKSIEAQQALREYQDNRKQNESVVYTTIVKNKDSTLPSQYQYSKKQTGSVMYTPNEERLSTQSKCQNSKDQNENVVYTSILSTKQSTIPTEYQERKSKNQSMGKTSTVYNGESVLPFQYPPCQCDSRKSKKLSFVYTSLVNNEEPTLTSEQRGNRSIMNTSAVRNDEPMISSQSPQSNSKDRKMKNENVVYTSIVGNREPTITSQYQDQRKENVSIVYPLLGVNDECAMLSQYPPCKCRERKMKNENVVYTSTVSNREPTITSQYRDQRKENVSVVYPSVVNNGEPLYPPCRCRQRKKENESFVYSSMVNNEEPRLSQYQNFKEENTSVAQTSMGNNAYCILQCPNATCNCQDNKKQYKNFEYPSLASQQSPPKKDNRNSVRSTVNYNRESTMPIQYAPCELQEQKCESIRESENVVLPSKQSQSKNRKKSILKQSRK